MDMAIHKPMIMTWFALGQLHWLWPMLLASQPKLCLVSLSLGYRSLQCNKHLLFFLLFLLHTVFYQNGFVLIQLLTSLISTAFQFIAH